MQPFKSTSLLSFFFMLVFPISLFASGPVVFHREYTYQAEGSDNLASCRMAAIEQVKRLLLEEIGVYLESRTEIENMRISKDHITAITAGILKTKILTEEWNGKTYQLTAEITADPDDIVKRIDAFRKDRERLDELWSAKKEYDNAHIALHSGNLDEAERLLARVAALYSHTEYGSSAAEQVGKIAEIRRYRVEQLDEIASKELNKFRAVIESYFADYMKLPKTIDDFRRSIFQDPSMLAANVFILYFPDTAAPYEYQYTVYSYHSGGSKVFVQRSDKERSGMYPVARTSGVIDDLKRQYVSVEKRGRFTILSRAR